MKLSGRNALIVPVIKSMKFGSVLVRIVPCTPTEWAMRVSRERERKRLKYIGIDPGKKGGIAVIDENGEVITVNTYDHSVYLRLLGSIEDCKICILERVNAMPGQGVTSMFNFGEGFGWLQGVLDSYKIPYELVTPQKWKRMFGCTSDKNTSIEVAHRLFPGIDFRRTERCKTDSDGIAEALLMAEYGRRISG